MPKFQVWSDLHVPVNHGAPPIVVPEDVDFVLVAGDIAAPVGKSMVFLEAEVAKQGRPVIFVAGNHEHYGEDYERSMTSGLEARPHCPGVHWLENEAVVLDGVRFLGCALWTDYDLFRSRELAVEAARGSMNDHYVIKSKGQLARHWKWSPEQALQTHRASRRWLEAALAEPFDGMTVIVTHHGPHPLSVAPQFAKDPVTPAFVSDLSAVIEKWQPDLWVHGHTHHSFDYIVPGTRTRVVCNPRGYGSENPRFGIGLTVEV